MTLPTLLQTKPKKMLFAELAKTYYQLCKPNVVALLLLTALVGMLLSAPTVTEINPTLFLFGMIGIALSSACAAVINQLYDRTIDETMRRTQHRPLPQKQISIRQGIIFATILGITGISVLFFLVNPLTAALTFCALIGYAFVYTVYLKHETPQNIVIGGVSGAVPPILGWSAMTGEVSVESLLLFAIIFIWTPPHFWALAIHRKNEYMKANIPMLPITHGIGYTQQHILLYKILLLVVSLFPFLIGMSGIGYLVVALGLGVWYLYYAILMIRNPDKSDLPMKSFSASIWYLMLLFCTLLLDHYFQLIV